VLPTNILDAIAKVVQEAENALLRPMQAGRASQEPDITSRLAQSIEVISQSLDGVTTELHVVNALGPGAAERDLGADLVGVVRLELAEVRATHGFLAQAKRAGTQGVHFRRAGLEADAYSPWLYRGSLELDRSGSVLVTRPSPDLEEQCENMLRVTPAAFVFVYDSTQVGVVSATAVRAMRGKSPGTRNRTELGTKRLDDFFVHLADGFIGDPKLIAADTTAVKAMAVANRARAGILLRVVSSREPQLQ
jgi:hypothetical protein